MQRLQLTKIDFGTGCRATLCCAMLCLTDSCPFLHYPALPQAATDASTLPALLASAKLSSLEDLNSQIDRLTADCSK